MQFVTLSEIEFKNFVNQHFSHYTQSSQHFNYRNEFQQDVHLVGVKNNKNKVIAACLLTEAQALKFFKYFYTHRGPIMDFNNYELVKFFFKNLTKYLKKRKCLYILTDPYILENKRDTEGNIIKSYDNKNLIKLMSKLGYIHQGYSTGYSQTSQIRWLSVLNLKNKNEDTLLKEMEYQTRRNIKKTYEMNVQVKTLPIEETARFFALFKMAEEKHGFKFMNKSYFEKMQKIYKNNSMLKLAYIDLTELLKKQEIKLDELKSQFNNLVVILKDNPNSKKNKNKYNQLHQQINAQNRKINKTKRIIKSDGNIIDLAAAFYIYNNNEVYYLSSGSNPKYNAYMGAYRLQWEMIKFAKNKNIPRYNFYGITGDFSESAEDYGVQKFKAGFNTHVEEYVGDFIKPINPFLYKINKLLH